MNKSLYIFLSAIVILLLVVLGALKKIETKIDSVEEKVADQGEKLTTLYDYADSEIHFEKDVQKKEQDTSLSLNVVHEFKNSQFRSKAKFHPQKNIIAVLVGDGSIKLFDVESTKEIESFKIQNEIPISFAFLYDGQSLLIGMKDGDLYRIDISTGQSTLVHDFGEREIARLDAAKNGNVAVGLGGSVDESKEGNSIFVYNLESQTILSEYMAFARDDFQGIAISPTGETVAIHEVKGKPRGGCLFNASTGEEIKLCYHQNYGCGPLSIDVAPDDKTMAVGYAPSDVIVWDTNDASVKWLFEGHSNWVVSLDFSDDMKYLASGAGDSTARVYDLQTGKEIGRVRFSGPSTYVDSVDISTDGKYVLAAISGFVGIYEMPK